MDDSLFSIVFNGLFISNILLTQFLGICPFLGVSKNLKSTLGMCSAISFVMVLSSIITWIIYHLSLEVLEITYLKTIVFILAIASLVQFVELFVKKKSPALYESMGVFLPLIATNCAIMGIALINIQKDYSFTFSIVNSLATAGGYTIVMVLFACIRERINRSNVPSSMEDLPIALITAGCMSLAFMGLSGIH